MIVKETTIPGCFEIIPRLLRDERGLFVKTYHQELFQQYNLNTNWCEEYYSKSYRGVLRGMHFQLPPYDLVKLVYCTDGAVLDAVVDLRKGSPAYGQHILLELNAEIGNILYLPRGLSHGFYVQSDSATILYKVSSVYAPQHDTGILWNSAGIKWPTKDPIISERDSMFPTLANFSSPFYFDDKKVQS